MAGRLDPGSVADAIRDDTLLVSVMLANNEIGVIHDVAEIGRICRERGVWLHCDATQAVGKLPVDVRQLNVDLLSFSAHKLYGPKGVGALYVRQGATPPLRLECQIAGGGHEHGLRSGTLNVPGIVGLAKALDLCLAEMPAEMTRLTALHNRLFEGLTAAVDRVTLNGPALELAGLRLPGNLNVSFDCVDGEALIISVEQLAVSSGMPARRPIRSRVTCWPPWESGRTRSAAACGSGWAGLTRPKRSSLPFPWWPKLSNDCVN